MTTSASALRQSFPSTKERWPHLVHSNAHLQAKGYLQNSDLDRTLSIETNRSDGSGVSVISFGPFCLLPTQRLLLHANKPVPIGSRALDILIALVERPGDLLSKDELIARVWPNIWVAPTNLAVQIANLRRTLDDGRNGNRFLINIPGRGYRFVAPVTVGDAGPLASAVAIDTTGERHLSVPLPLSNEHADNIGGLLECPSQPRLLTGSGLGGAGKTTMVLGVPERMIDAHEHGVWPIDLSPSGDPSLVPSALAAAFLIMMLDDERAITAVAKLLPANRGERDVLIGMIGRVLTSDRAFEEEGKRRMARIEILFGESPGAASFSCGSGT